jgi:hypothetical protein
MAGRHVRVLVASYRNSGALLDDGAYMDWGYDGEGQLGDGSFGVASSVPVTVPLPLPVTRVALGGSDPTNGQTLVRLSDGPVRSWILSSPPPGRLRDVADLSHRPGCGGRGVSRARPRATAAGDPSPWRRVARDTSRRRTHLLIETVHIPSPILVSTTRITRRRYQNRICGPRRPGAPPGEPYSPVKRNSACQGPSECTTSQ